MANKEFLNLKIKMAAIAWFSVAHENGQCEQTRRPQKHIYTGGNGDGGAQRGRQYKHIWLRCFLQINSALYQLRQIK